MRHVYLEYEPFAQKWLSIEEQERMQGVDVDVCIEPESHCINGVILHNRRLPLTEIQQQNHIVQKLVARLYEDQVVQAML